VLYWGVSPSGKLPDTTAKLASNYGNSIQSGRDNFAEVVPLITGPLVEPVLRRDMSFGLVCMRVSSTLMGGLVWELIRGSIYNVQRHQYLHHRIPHLWRYIRDYRPRRLLFSFRYRGHCHSSTTNSGSATGVEVAELYTGLPSTASSNPVRQLRNFQKVSIKAGAGAVISFKLRK
jgi:beta-glucosidase